MRFNEIRVRSSTSRLILEMLTRGKDVVMIVSYANDAAEEYGSPSAHWQVDKERKDEHLLVVVAK